MANANRNVISVFLSLHIIRIAQLISTFYFLTEPTLPPAICPYGYMPVLYDYDDDSFVTLVDMQRNVDVLDGSKHDIEFDDLTDHQITIRRDKLPKSFNINYIKMTVIGGGTVTLTVTSILGQSASKTVRNSFGFLLWGRFSAIK